MVFAIANGKPYGIKGNQFYPCTISENGYCVGTIPIIIDAKGRYSDREIRAKLNFKGIDLTSMDPIEKKEPMQKKRTSRKK